MTEAQLARIEDMKLNEHLAGDCEHELIYSLGTHHDGTSFSRCAECGKEWEN